MSPERRGWDIHAFWIGADGTNVAGVRFRVRLLTDRDGSRTRSRLTDRGDAGLTAETLSWTGSTLPMVLAWRMVYSVLA